MKPNLVRVLKAEIALEVQEDKYRKQCGEKGATMTDADLKHFFLDDFVKLLKQEINGEDFRKLIAFSFTQEWKEHKK